MSVTRKFMHGLSGGRFVEARPPKILADHWPVNDGRYLSDGFAEARP